MSTYAEALDEIRARQRANWPEGVPREISYPIPDGGIVDYLRHWADIYPDREAIWFYGTSISYRELASSVARFAGWLQRAGVKPGDRVGVFLANSPQFVIAMLGILWTGAVHVPINPLFREHELTHELTDADVEVLVVQSDLRPLVEKVRDKTSVRAVVTTALGDLVGPDTADGIPLPFPTDVAPAHHGDTTWTDTVAAAPVPPHPTDLDALAALNYTGGTTGMPKGCEHTQRHMVYTAAGATVAQGRAVGEKPDVSLCFLPIFWIAGEDFGILVPILNGGTVVLLTRWDPELVLTLIESKHVTSMVGTVDNYVELMSRSTPGQDLTSLESGLAVSFVLKLTPDIRAQWRERTGHVLREASYGMTETHTADTITLGFQDDDWDLSAEPVFCGLPVPGTDLLIIDPHGSPVGVDEVGEILVRSPSVLSGYYGRPEATAEALRDGWLHTGDTGKLNSRGALHYLGRSKEMIKTNGMSVFPSEVESLLGMHPDVELAAVVPMADARRGQVPLAFVRLTEHSTSDADALKVWAAEQMASYKVPQIEIVGDLPMTATGKIKKGELFTRASELGDHQG